MSLLVDVVAGGGRPEEAVYRLMAENRRKYRKYKYGCESKKKVAV